MDFRSDNASGAHPAILEALGAASRGSAAAYGDDAWTARLTERLRAVFEHDVAVLPVATGTAANSLALSLFTPPWGVVFCHEVSHVHVAECGAPELFTGGAKLAAVPGASAKVTPDAVEGAIRGKGFVHAPQPAAISISQSTEAGTVYRAGEVAALGELARRHGLALHMDGARFANALVTTQVTPAELTWKAGVDVLSFGGTKNGCFAAEAVILFDPSRAAEAGYRRKRSGHLVSKMRWISAQLEAYLTDDLWLMSARHANDMALRLSTGLGSTGYAVIEPVETNQVFVRFPDGLARKLRARGFSFLDWPLLGEGARRLVTSFETRVGDIELLVDAARQYFRIDASVVPEG